jgi:CRP/FNR family transcriptional regulator, anaerobic regulatory protein
VTTHLVQDFPFLAGCAAATRAALEAQPVRHVGPFTRVLERGDAVDGVYLVTAGTLRVYYLTPEGREATLYWVEQGQTCILALTAAFRQEQYPAWVETDHRSLRYVLVPGELFRRLYDTEPAFREFVFTVLSGRVFELMGKLEELGSLRVEQRLAAFLLAQGEAEGVVRMSQARIAAHLGTAREVVFRAVRSLAARGVVSTTRGQVRLLDAQALAKLAGR